MLSDKLVGPKVRLVLLKFLPSLFVEALSDSCETALHMFDNNHENPELVRCFTIIALLVLVLAVYIFYVS